ncbi:uncharacterized protein TNCV_4025371 [Trichonephila clavipes]|uniref:Uncharacterized protein n=1 Tax=Trichonephila clavipes TaxID=2585209 RepID=A0A8X7BJ04_TRICX|nr:uncharacterized protein TNCV_4025371 [Trichonephila clavipes]
MFKEDNSLLRHKVGHDAHVRDVIDENITILMRILPLLIGDKVPYNNHFWNLYLLMLTIIDTLMAPVISLPETYALAENIADHHKLFLILFPNRHLTPKMHFALHYPRIIRQLGPPVRYWNEGIDEESFLLDDETMKLLIPKAGPRLKFKKYLNSFIEASNFSSVPTSDSTVPPCNTDITYSCINDSLTIFPHPVSDISDLDASDTYIGNYDCKPSTKDKLDLAKDIVSTFPVLKGSDGEGQETSVVEKEELGIGQIKKNIKEKIIKYQGTEDSSVEFLQKQQWLKENTSPPDKVLLLMQETFEGRRFEISRNATNFVSNWPRILDPHVIEAEFNMLYGEQKSDSLCLGFGMTANLIIHQAKHCGRKCAEEFANSLNFDLDSTEPSSEKICCALTLLPLLLPQRVFRRNGPKKLKIRPTSSQMLDHFIQFIPAGEGIDKFMKDDRLLGGERREPFILAIGEKCRPQQLFLIFEENCIEESSRQSGWITNFVRSSSRALALNSREQLIREQREDPELGHIYRYLENPDDGSVNATICENWSQDFELIDGLLFYAKYYTTLGELRVYVPRSLRETIMKEFHDLPLAGHLGID